MALELWSENRVKIANDLISNDSPNQIAGSPWLRSYVCNPGDFMDSPILLSRVVASAIVCSGAICLGLNSLYSFDVVRLDGSMFDTDLHLLTNSVSGLFMETKIKKDVGWHNSPQIPPHYIKFFENG